MQGGQADNVLVSLVPYPTPGWDLLIPLLGLGPPPTTLPDCPAPLPRRLYLCRRHVLDDARLPRAVVHTDDVLVLLHRQRSAAQGGGLRVPQRLNLSSRRQPCPARDASCDVGYCTGVYYVKQRAPSVVTATRAASDTTRQLVGVKLGGGTRTRPVYMCAVACVLRGFDAPSPSPFLARDGLMHTWQKNASTSACSTSRSDVGEALAAFAPISFSSSPQGICRTT